jgi:hypothetical protein
MKRIAAILASLALTGGSSGEPELAPRPGDVQGFTDGYLSACPEKSYAHSTRTDYPHATYGHGWTTGHTTGTKDEQYRP